MKTIACLALAGLLSVLSIQESHAEGYLFGDIGYSKNFYGNDPPTRDFVGTQLPTATSHVPIGFDLGWMFKLVPHFTLGLAWDASYDYFYQNNTNTSAGAVAQNALVFTSRQYFGSDFGRGLYTRFDAGLGWLATTGNVYSASSMSANAQGLFLLAGLGASIAVPPSGGIYFEVDASRLFLGAGPVYTIQPKVGLVISFGGKGK